MIKKSLYELINNDNNMTVPKYVVNYAKKVKLDTNSLILLIYLINGKNGAVFDHKKIMEELNFSEKDILEAMSLLKEKKILSIEMSKNDFGILEEVINISAFYDIIFSEIINKEKETKEESDLYSAFEKEFGRTLSPMEVDIISNWKESNISDELILAALKESIFNGVGNLRYIDKILYEWNKKGIKNAAQIDNYKKKEEEEKDETYYEYDWLNE